MENTVVYIYMLGIANTSYDSKKGKNRDRLLNQKREGGRIPDIMHGRSLMAIDPRIPTMPGRNTSGFHQPGRHCLHQASAKRRRGEFHHRGNKKSLNKLITLLYCVLLNTSISSIRGVSKFWYFDGTFWIRDSVREGKRAVVAIVPPGKWPHGSDFFSRTGRRADGPTGALVFIEKTVRSTKTRISGVSCDTDVAMSCEL